MSIILSGLRESRRLSELMNLALNLFEKEDDAVAWMLTSNNALENKNPASTISSFSDFKKAKRLLNKLITEYNNDR